MGSDRVEASEFNGFCTIRFLRERYFPSVQISSKILVLLNHFIFVNLFELVILLDHCPTLLNVSSGALLTFLEMPVNLYQYRATIGVFNNCDPMTSKKHYYFSETSNVRSDIFFTKAINVMVLVFILFMFKAFFKQKK